MSLHRHYTLVPDAELAPDRAARLARHLRRSHHAMRVGAAERLEAACLDAVPDLFDGVRVARAADSVRVLMRGQAPAAPGLHMPITRDIPRATWGPTLAEAQIVLRALRPSRVRGAGPDLLPHLSALRVLLRYVVPTELRLVTWVAC